MGKLEQVSNKTQVALHILLGDLEGTLEEKIGLSYKEIQSLPKSSSEKKRILLANQIYCGGSLQDNGESIIDIFMSLDKMNKERVITVLNHFV